MYTLTQLYEHDYVYMLESITHKYISTEYVYQTDLVIHLKHGYLLYRFIKFLIFYIITSWISRLARTSLG